jgi:protein gp37
MNKTKIEWADYTWNPVTGCLHGCEYCYARKIANRFKGYSKELASEYQTSIQVYSECGVIAALEYPLAKHTTSGEMISPYPFGFDPTFFRYRLDEPARKTKGQKIFVCSMADLFGDWVPDEWIEEVFKACEAAPQHKYLFLTKNPSRYAQLNRTGILPEGKNYWYGATFDHSNWSDKKGGHDPGDFYFPDIDNRNTFISFEPLLRNFNIGGTRAKWHIIGAETGNRKNKIIPKREWVESIVEYSQSAGTSVFMKNSLMALMGDDFIQEWPESLQQNER